MNAPSPITRAENAEAVTARSRSNLALSFLALPRPVREDMEILYAFCRIIDDIADETALPVEERRAALAEWGRALAGPLPDGAPALAGPLRAMAARRGIPEGLLREILTGVEMDLGQDRYETAEALAGYCYRVACCVGLASLRVFGCEGPAAECYAIALGHALQWTNILRDVASDLRERGRVYLPLEDLRRFGVAEEDLLTGGEAFTQLMEFEAARAEAHFSAAAAAKRELSRTDRARLSAAEFMGDAYRILLRRMRADRFRVFAQTYRLGSADKLALVARSVWRRVVP